MAPTFPTLDSLRRQLEGRWEHLERARERNTALLRRLGAWGWKQELRRQPGLLREAREREEALHEALTAVEQRAQREQWPPGHPALGVLRELRAQREKLIALTNKRLDPSTAIDSWPRLLERLEGVVLEPDPRPLEATELVLLEGWSTSRFMPGRFALTVERLLWRPLSGRPMQVALAPLDSGDITLTLGGFGVSVRGPQRVILAPRWQASSLAGLMELCRRMPRLRHTERQVQEAVICPAFSHRAEYPTEQTGGLAILRPEGVAFLPTRAPTPLDHVLRWVGKEVRLPRNEELLWQEALIEHLRRLPPAEFDAGLRALVQARGGHWWPAAEVHRGPDAEGFLQLERREQVLALPLNVRPGQVRSFLEQYLPSAATPDPARPWTSAWRKFAWERVGLAGGMLLMGVLFASRSLPLELGWTLLLLARSAFSWSCMRYTKAKGYPPLAALGLSLLCWLGTPAILLIPGRKKKRPAVMTRPGG